MGRRDYRHRESKKAKKAAKKKAGIISVLAQPTEVEVIRKEKRKPEE